MLTDVLLCFLPVLSAVAYNMLCRGIFSFQLYKLGVGITKWSTVQQRVFNPWIVAQDRPLAICYQAMRKQYVLAAKAMLIFPIILIEMYSLFCFNYLEPGAVIFQLASRFICMFAVNRGRSCLNHNLYNLITCMHTCKLIGSDPPWLPYSFR